MTKGKKQLYEGLYIISSQLSEEARGRVLEKITGGVTAAGGEIKHTIDMGRRKLAYEINGHREGNYYLVYFELDSLSVAEQWKEYRLNEDLIRFMTTRTEVVRENLEFKPLASADKD